MRAVLIYNPWAGWRNGIQGHKIQRLLRQTGIEADLYSTAGPGDATLIARRAVNEGAQLVIVYGGDGTINEVICGMAGSKARLGILPGGTANVLAKELGIPAQLEQAARVIAEGGEKIIPLGLAGSRLFHCMAGIGVDGSIVKNLNARLKRYLGLGGYWIEGLRHLFTYNMPTFLIRIDDMEYQATFAVIGNARNYGGNLIITPHAILEEEMFDVCIFLTQNKLRYALYIPFAYAGRHVQFNDVVCLKADRVWAESNCGSEVFVQVDGELAGTLPMQFRVVPKALIVLVPRKEEKS